jgi:hypothetical protein
MDLIFKMDLTAGCWWLKPIILATWEAEIRKITVERKPRQIVHKTGSSKYPTQNRLVEGLT